MSQEKSPLNQIEKCFKKSMKRSVETFRSNWPSPNWEIPESNILLRLGCEFLKNSHECYTEIQVEKKRKEHFDMVTIDRKQKWVLVTEAKFIWDAETAGKLGEDWVRMRDNRVTSSAVEAASGYTRYGALFAMTSHKSIGDWWKARAESSRPAGRRQDEPWKQLAEAIRRAERIGCREFDRAGDERPMSIMYALLELGKSRR